MHVRTHTSHVNKGNHTKAIDVFKRNRHNNFRLFVSLYFSFTSFKLWAPIAISFKQGNWNISVCNVCSCCCCFAASFFFVQIIFFINHKVNTRANSFAPYSIRLWFRIEIGNWRSYPIHLKHIYFYCRRNQNVNADCVVIYT